MFTHCDVDVVQVEIRRLCKKIVQKLVWKLR